MPNSLTAAGLLTATSAELVANYTAAFQAVYGADINLDSSTPDGQMMMIFLQSVLDLEDLLTQIYNSFDPDNAIGVVLDQRVAINGIQRQAGTFTVTNITIVTSQSLTLFGSDQFSEVPYTISDNAGNQWQLITSLVAGSAGTYVAAFSAVLPGAVLTVPNTIQTFVTIVLGVTSVNNPTTYTTLGLNEETDAALKIRRQKSVSLGSQGYRAGLEAALENINGVTFEKVYENDTNATDGNGVPSHSIWVIVAGTGAVADIAQAIYTKRNAGAGMFGAITFNVTQPDGTLFTVRWDTVTSQNLYIKFTATSLNGTSPPNIAAIRAGLPLSFVPGVAQEVNVNNLATLVQQIDPNTLVTFAGFSLTSGGSYTTTLTPSAKNFQFAVASARIIIIPIILTPTTSSVAPLGTETFVPQGGFGPYVFSMSSAPSGGTINSSTGVYIAGSTGLVTDVVLVTDAQGHTATASVSVTS